jgi:hypothetical protein
MEKELTGKIKRGWFALNGVLKAIYLVTAIMGVVFTGSPAGSTLPVAAGNEWVYAYKDSTYHLSGGMVGAPGYSSRDTTNIGILTMKLGAVAKRSDSTFFPISYTDSGTQADGYQFNSDDHSVTHSKYGKSYNKEYKVVADTLFCKDSSGAWQVENDSEFSYTPQTDTTDSVSGFFMNSKYSRKTTAFVNYSGADTVKGFDKIILSTYSIRDNSNSFYCDTIRWSDKIGLLHSSGGFLSNSSGGDGFANNNAHFSSFSLVRFNSANLNVGVRMRLASSTITAANNRRPLYGKNVSIGSPLRRPSGAEVYNLNGQKVKNRAGRQLLIIVH